MTTRILVLGAGYAGVGVVQRIEAELADPEVDLDAELVWVSDHDHHFVLHEAHLIIRNRHLGRVLTIPADRIKSPDTEFVVAEVDDIATERRAVEFADGSAMDYDYVVDCLGSRTAFYGIEGLESNALTLKSRADALALNRRVRDVARAAARDDPRRIVVGGAGPSGIQSAGEIAAVCHARDAPVEVVLVEAMDDVYPGHSHAFQGMLEDRLEDHDVEIRTGAPITGVDESSIGFAEGESLDYDLLLWTGGITGLDEVDAPHVHVTDDRVQVDSTLQSDDERLFAVGDAAIIDRDEDSPPPPTAQAAWRAADVAGANVVRAIRGRPLRPWRYGDAGTLISVGDDVVATGIPFVPVRTFDGRLAKFLKKSAGARWLANADSWRRAMRAWPDL